MDQTKERFTHTDGRVFTHTGNVLHVTRDKRTVSLHVWKALCVHEGCTAHITARTAIDTPWLWSGFRPRRYCPKHLTKVKAEGSIKGIQARADGLARWRESDKGKAVLAKRMADVVGTIEQMVYDTAKAMALVEDEVQWSEVSKAVYAQMGEPAEGKRDTRTQRIRRALYTLQEKGRLRLNHGVLNVLR